MRNKLTWVAFCIIVLILSFLEFHSHGDISETFSFSEMPLKYGASGIDVRELQSRLKFLGFYYGQLDGQFGQRTLHSTKWFQGDFGLRVDGVAGPKTKQKLWEATKAWVPDSENNPASVTTQQNQQQDANSQGGQGGQAVPVKQHSFSKNDIDLMANAVYGEARGESHEGQVAVAAVILNRVKSELFPNTISGVIFEPRAFTAVADGQIYLTPNENARKAVQEALNGLDPTDGCIYYFNPDTATSSWIWSRPQYRKIGKHIFCR